MQETRFILFAWKSALVLECGGNSTNACILLNKAKMGFVLFTVPPREMLGNVQVNGNYKNTCFLKICAKRFKNCTEFNRKEVSFELEAERISCICM